jgi:hypothetical protein
VGESCRSPACHHRDRLKTLSLTVSGRAVEFCGDSGAYDFVKFNELISYDDGVPPSYPTLPVPCIATRHASFVSSHRGPLPQMNQQWHLRKTFGSGAKLPQDKRNKLKAHPTYPKARMLIIFGVPGSTQGGTGCAKGMRGGTTASQQPS